MGPMNKLSHYKIRYSQHVVCVVNILLLRAVSKNLETSKIQKWKKKNIIKVME